MYKKGTSLILTVAFMLILSTATFAGIQLNPVEAGDITLIEPQIGTEAQVFVKDSMAISIRSESDHTVYVSLYKVMPSIRDAYLDEACDSEMILTAEDVPFKVISGGSIVTRDSVSDIPDNDLEDAGFEESDFEDDSTDSDSIINGSEVLLQKDKLSSKERQSIIKAFKSEKKSFEKQLKVLEDSYDAYTENFIEGHEDNHEYTQDELKVIKSYLQDVEDAQEKCLEYTIARDAYEAIFETPLFGPEDLTDTGILPYYQKTVEQITPGLYKFVFTKQDKSIVDSIEFEVVKKEELTEEDIKEAMPSTLGDLILPVKEEIQEEVKEEIEEEIIDETITVTDEDIDDADSVEPTEDAPIDIIEEEPVKTTDSLIKVIEEEQLEEKPTVDNTDE